MFMQSRPMPCKYCGKVICCNMYRHVARLHLDLAQLWRCPVSWCTMWKGTPQDCMEHLRNGHDVPVDIEDSQHQMIRPTLDSASGIMDGVAATGTLGHID